MEPNYRGYEKIDYFLNPNVSEAVDKITRGEDGYLEDKVRTDSKISGLQAVQEGFEHIGRVIRHIVLNLFDPDYRTRFENAFTAKPIGQASPQTQHVANRVGSSASAITPPSKRPPQPTTPVPPTPTASAASTLVTARQPPPTTPAPTTPPPQESMAAAQSQAFVEEGPVIASRPATSTVPPAIGEVQPARVGEEETEAKKPKKDKGELGEPDREEAETVEVAFPAPLAEPAKAKIDLTKVPQDKKGELKRSVSNIREQVKQLRGAERRNESDETFYLTRKALIRIELDKVINMIKGIDEYKNRDIKPEDLIAIYKEIETPLPDDTPSLKTDSFYRKTEEIFKEVL